MAKLERNGEPTRVVGVGVEKALRVERANRLGDQELGTGDLVEPTKRVVTAVVRRVVKTLGK